jgi:hypothetical protein
MLFEDDVDEYAQILQVMLKNAPSAVDVPEPQMKFTCLMLACAKKDKQVGARLIQIILGACKEIDINQ